jgi:hypothetical protein
MALSSQHGPGSIGYWSRTQPALYPSWQADGIGQIERFKTGYRRRPKCSGVQLLDEVKLNSVDWRQVFTPSAPTTPMLV